MVHVVLIGATGVVCQTMIPMLEADPAITKITAVARSYKSKAAAAAGGSDEKAASKLVYAGVDCSEREALAEVCKTADAVCFGVGMPYDSRVWAKEFPPALQNSLDATPADALFLLIDNLYMLGREGVSSGKPLKEDMPLSKTGLKPPVRALMDQMVLDRKKNFAIVRASDFYGPDVTKAFLTEFIFEKFASDSAPQCVYSSEAKHTYTYVPDFAKAIIAVIKKKSSWDQIYHVPNAEPLKFTELVERAAKAYGLEKPPAAPVVLGCTSMYLFSLWDRMGTEVKDLEYQWRLDYLVDHSKFMETFPELAGELPTKWDDGLEATVKWYKALKAKEAKAKEAKKDKKH